MMAYGKGGFRLICTDFHMRLRDLGRSAGGITYLRGHTSVTTTLAMRCANPIHRDLTYGVHMCINKLIKA